MSALFTIIGRMNLETNQLNWWVSHSATGSTAGIFLDPEDAAQCVSEMEDQIRHKYGLSDNLVADEPNDWMDGEAAYSAWLAGYDNESEGQEPELTQEIPF